MNTALEKSEILNTSLSNHLTKIKGRPLPFTFILLAGCLSLQPIPGDLKIIEMKISACGDQGSH